MTTLVHVPPVLLGFISPMVRQSEYAHPMVVLMVLWGHTMANSDYVDHVEPFQASAPLLVTPIIPIPHDPFDLDLSSISLKRSNHPFGYHNTVPSSVVCFAT